MSLNQFKDSRKVEVVPHNPAWRFTFLEDSKQITLAMGENVVTIHHIGSTAIPNIYAKPIIDCLIEVKDIAKVDEQNPAMAALGYAAMGKFSIPDLAVSSSKIVQQAKELTISTHLRLNHRK